MIQWFLHRPVTVTMICLSLLVVGLISLQKIPLQLLPDFEVPNIKIEIQWPGSTAQEQVESVLEPLERALATLPKLKSMISKGITGRSEVRLEFKTGADLKTLIPLIKDRLDSVSFPEGVQKPSIQRLLMNQGSIFTMAIPERGGLSLEKISKILQSSLVLPLERVEGVALVKISGAPVKQLHLNVSPEVVMGQKISLNEISEALMSRTRWTTLGMIKNNDSLYQVKMGSPYKSLDDLLSTQFGTDGSKNPRVEQVVEVKTENVISDLIVKLNQKPSVLIDVYKDAEANAVDVGERVRQVLQNEMPKNLTSEILGDRGQEIKSAIDNVKSTVVSGALMAAVIIYLLIQSPWPSFVVTVIIPLSLLMTFILMSVFGVTFNLMSLSGLALGVGMLVDNSTVVLESIQEQAKKMTDPFQAALFGTQKVFAATAVSTLSTLAVFIPLIFIQGAIGFYFQDVAKTVSMSLLSSLILSVVVIPILSVKKVSASNSLKDLVVPFLEFKHDSNSGLRETLTQQLQLAQWAFQTFVFGMSFLSFRVYHLLFELMSFVERRYLKIVLERFDWFFHVIENWIVQRVMLHFEDQKRYLGLAGLIVVIGGVGWMMTGSELFPEEVSSSFEIELHLPNSLSHENSGRTLDQFSAFVSRQTEVQKTLLTRQAKDPSSGRMIVFANVSDQHHLMEKITKYTENTSQLQAIRVTPGLATQDPPLVIEVYGEEAKERAIKTQKVLEMLGNLDYLKEVHLNSPFRNQDVRVELDRSKISLLNADIGQFQNILFDLFSIRRLGQFKINETSMPVLLQTKNGFISEPTDMNQVFVEVEDRKKMFLSAISNIKLIDVEATVQRRDRVSFNSIQAHVQNSSLGDVAHRLENLVRQKFGSNSGDIQIAGQNRERKESLNQLGVALVLSIFVIYVLLASQFESLLQPLIILFAVPFCLIGIVTFLGFFSIYISATVMVGCILLVGVSVNTSIILVDLANRLLEEGQTPVEAILNATKLRSRPIIVTTLANILGLVPMLFTFGEPGGSMQFPMAATLIGGLFSSTILTLLILPLVYVQLTKSQSFGP